MIASQRFYRKTSFWITFVLVGFALLFLFNFRNEICAFVYNRPCGPEGSQIRNRLDGLRVLVQFAIVFIASLVASMFLISQFVLPVHTASERFNVFSRLTMHISREHGPTIFVRDGKQIASTEELESSLAGVAFVDPCSAIVLEKQWKPRLQEPSRGPLSFLFKSSKNHQTEQISIPPPLVRAAGPGIVFTNFGERIIGTADLRKQFRINQDIQAYTADGLEMKANVFVIFSLGMPPEVLKVAYLGEEKPENLRVLRIDRRPKMSHDGKFEGGSVEFIHDIVDELDPEDRSPQHNQSFVDRGEVHRHAQIKAEMRNFLDEITPISADILHQFIDSLNPQDRATIHRFVDILYFENRHLLYRIVDHLMPIDLPEVGIYRVAINRTILHQIIDEFENYLTKAELPVNKLHRKEKQALHRFIDQLFTGYSPYVHQFYASLNQLTGVDIQGVISSFVQKYWLSKEHPRPPRLDKTPPFKSPFIFNPERVFHAIYARGRNLKAGMPTGPDDWSKQPTQIATELYRQELSLANYDDIYLPHDPTQSPLIEKIKKRFTGIMSHSGVLAYQLIRRRDGKRIEFGQELNAHDFNLDYPIMEFHQPKPLRERGIRVIRSGFSELKPTAIDKKEEPTAQTQQPPTPIPVVRKQRFDTWQAKWQKESELIKAESELELMHIRSRARAQAQQDMTIALSQILEDTDNSPEAMAMRVFQALEAAATDPSTHQLLPRDTIDMLRSLRQWLMPGEDDNSNMFDGEWVETDDLTSDSPEVDET